MSKERFKAELVKAYTELFESDPAYSRARRLHTPEQLAEKMVDWLAVSKAEKNGQGVIAACLACGIKNTYKGIAEFLTK
jgi:hypothetical protein